MVAARSPSRRGVVATLFAALTVLAVTAGGTAATGSHVAIEEDAVEQAHGDVAEFTVSVPRGESATLVVGNGSDRHRLTLTDRIADGEVSVSANTHLAGPNATASEVYAADGRDTVTAVSNGTAALGPGTHRVAVYANETDEEPADTATLRLTDPGPVNASVLVAPGEAADRLDSLSAVERGREGGWVTPADRVAETDTVVLALTVPGIAGAVANETGITTEMRFRSFLDRPNVSLTAVQRTHGPERNPQHFLFDGTNVSAVAADPDDDTYYVSARLVDLPYFYADSDRWTDDGDLRTDQPNLYDDVLVPRLTVDGIHRLNPGDLYEGNHTAAFAATWPEATLSRSKDHLLEPGYAAGPNQTVVGYTNVAPGTEVTVSVTGAVGIETPRNATGVVTRERVPMVADYEPPRYVVRASLNLSGVEPGTEIDLALAPADRDRAGEYRFDEHRAPVDSPLAGLSLADDPLANGTVRVANATLPSGGFVVVERADDGVVLASSDRIDPGTHENIAVNVSGQVSGSLRVSLAHDSDGNGRYTREADRSYADGMESVGVTVPDPTSATPTPSSASTSTELPTATSSPTPSSTVADPTVPPTSTVTVHSDPPLTATPTQATGTGSPDGTTASDGPGFGAVAALAAVALAGTLLLARRGRVTDD
ncbi:hypothetical protein HZS55_00935 [Halosimplex rubrum]|uniref:PGF-CTERM sorting domain-containing protein n=1 Tax=Halosimplex rubrum TaxID=869889 RepID=A0A7D5TLL8_9EURY|nr:hypothetical protein [Halosimplex rubrum]QLH75954.1 hypothetical protein HZS55_00935 [Halosimplex rubrum]